jgi:hypothetical protein
MTTAIFVTLDGCCSNISVLSWNGVLVSLLSASFGRFTPWLVPLGVDFHYGPERTASAACPLALSGIQRITASLTIISG